jgi:hypothetical protein
MFQFPCALPRHLFRVNTSRNTVPLPRQLNTTPHNLTISIIHNNATPCEFPYLSIPYKLETNVHRNPET